MAIKIIFLGVCITFLNWSSAIRAREEGGRIPLPQTDKAAHFSVSALGTASTIKIWSLFEPTRKVTITNRITSSLFWFTVGIWKESYDKRVKRTHFDLSDMAANGCGVLYGNVLMIDF